MNIVLVASLVVLLTIVVGVILALLFVNLSNIVTANQVVLEKEKTGYNQRTTAGHKIMVQADPETQLAQAQLLAAQQAAQLPRGANMGIRPKAAGEKLQAASDGVERDPITAAKIALFHTWGGLQYRSPKPAPAGAPAQARPAAQPAGPTELRPGIDYPFIEITDSMAPEERRKATIANSKAKAAAMKAAKSAGTGAAAPEAAAVESGVTAPTASAAAAPTTGGTGATPIAGVHYQEIPITPDMSPEERRKATIANSKAKAAAAKELKASGATAAVAQPEGEIAAAAPTPVAPAAAAPVSDVPKPDLIEITEGMSPDELRKARIENSKRMSAYNKALKAAGIDPTTIK